MRNMYIEGYSDPNSYYHKEASDLAARMPTDATYEGGVMRWNRNGNIPPRDIVEFAHHIGLPVDLSATNRAREQHDDEVARQYRKNSRHMDSENFAEMCAAFGPGQKIVDVLSGRRYQTLFRVDLR